MCAATTRCHPDETWSSCHVINPAYPHCILEFQREYIPRPTLGPTPEKSLEFGMDLRLSFALKRCGMRLEKKHYRLYQTCLTGEVWDIQNAIEEICEEVEDGAIAAFAVGQRGDMSIIKASVDLLSKLPYHYRRDIMGHLFQGIGYGGHLKLYMEMIEQEKSIDRMQSALHFACLRIPAHEDSNQRKLIDFIMSGVTDDEDNDFGDLRTLGSTTAHLGLCGAAYAGNLSLVLEMSDRIDWDLELEIGDLDDATSAKEAMASGNFDVIRRELSDGIANSMDFIRDHFQHMTQSPFSTPEIFDYLHYEGFTEAGLAISIHDMDHIFYDVIRSGNTAMIRHLSSKFDWKHALRRCDISDEDKAKVFMIVEPQVKRAI
jgi:hypothetical protein